MAKRTVASIWRDRIPVEEKFYSKWADTFMCTTLEDYWENFQWQQTGIGKANYKPYSLNMVYSTIKIKLANIIYQRPQYILKPTPIHMDWNAELAARVANIKGGALNTVVQNRKAFFVKNARLSALDSFFRFGIMEVGYEADWQNPGKSDIVTKQELDVEAASTQLSKLTVEDDEEIPDNERLFFKHVKARRFRVSGETPIMDHADWFGYYMFIKKSVLVKTKGLDLPLDIKNEYFSSAISEKYIKRHASSGTYGDYLDSNAYFKVWRLWDNNSKNRELVIESPEWPIIFSQKYDRNPFSSVCWDDRAPSKENVGWYPMPPVWQWISAQDEINQAREQLRNYRKRAIRKFWANKNTSPEEQAKLASNEDGSVINLKGNATGEQSVGIIQNPQADGNINESLQVSGSDMNLITGTSSNARQQTDRTTATESKIIDIRSQVRESVEQMDFSEFINDIGLNALLTMEETFSEGMWVKLTLDPSESFLEEYQDSEPVYKFITNDQLAESGYQWEVSLDVVNGTPAQMQEEKTKYFEFITVVFKAPQIALSPVLLRETAIKCGYTNERVIRELQKAATMQFVTQLQAQQGANGGNGAAGSIVKNGKPAPTDQIESQLNTQMGG